MSDLVTWLRQQLDEDALIAQATREAGTGDPGTTDEMGRLVFGDRAVNVWATAHLGRWSPRRVLAEVEAKRRIVDRWDDLREEVIHWQGIGDDDAAPTATEWAYGQVVRVLALPYADRDGYDEAWRP